MDRLPRPASLPNRIAQTLRDDIAAGRFAGEVLRLKCASSLAQPRLLEETLAEYLETGGYDHHLRLIRRHFMSQMERLRGTVAARFPQGTRATLPTSRTNPPRPASTHGRHAACRRRLLFSLRHPPRCRPDAAQIVAASIPFTRTLLGWDFAHLHQF